MKTTLFILISLLSSIAYAQSYVPERYWIEDSNFEQKIKGPQKTKDVNKLPVVVEFWASFNAHNCFADWDKIKDAVYYRVDLSKAPIAKRKYKIRMTPTIIIFKKGIKKEIFKAGLDLLLPTSLSEVQRVIDEINTASK
jgi:thiol-disulfide isomerase/thioredoxin